MTSVFYVRVRSVCAHNYRTHHPLDEGLDAIPNAMDAYLAAKRDATRAQRRAERTARRDGLRAVPDAD